MKRLLSIVVITLFLLNNALATEKPTDRPRKTASKPVANGFNPNARAEQQRQLFNRLNVNAAYPQQSGIQVILSDSEKSSLSHSNEKNFKRVDSQLKQKIGLVRKVNKTVDFSLLGNVNLGQKVKPFALGHIYSKSGQNFWTGAIEAVDATAMRIHFAGFNLPTSAKLYLFNAEGQAFGPYIGRGRNDNGQFWSHTISGSLAYIQVEFDDSVTSLDFKNTRFTIANIGYIGASFKLLNLWATCQQNEDCIYDADDSRAMNRISTVNAVNIVNNTKQAVGHMQFVSGRYIYLCSGGLLADSVASGRNYFLTANHCISKGNEANSLEAYFFFSDCGNADTPPRTIGSSILSSNRKSDYTLLELDGNVPAGTIRLGWNANEVASIHEQPLYRISHPQGAPQAYSDHTVDTSNTTCRSWPRGAWIYSRDSFGATDGGSSGSPVVDAAGLVVGQLSGACGFNLNDVCDAEHNATVDGALAAYFDNVSQWLAPTGAPNPDPEPNPDSDFSVVLSADSTPGRGERWTVTVNISVAPAIATAVVTGQWSGKAKGSGNCTTNNSGQCTVSKNNLKPDGSATFTLTSIEHPEYGYSGNDSITVSSPTQ